MSAFFSKLFALFMSKIAKTEVFALCCEILIAEVRLRFNLERKCRSKIAKFRCASTESKFLCGSCAALQKFKKLDCAFCAALLLIEKIVALCCAADIMLFMPTCATT